MTHTAPVTRARIRPRGELTRSVVPIRGGALVPAIFCVHSSTGGVAEFIELAQRLDAGQQFFGLQSRGVADDERPLSTVEAMASAYLQEAMRVQPKPPYLFAAWSMGGYVALEMARQAADLGREVARVFLIAPPHDRLDSRWKRHTEWRAARAHLKTLDDKIEAGSAPRERELLPLWDLNDDPLRDPDDEAAEGEDGQRRLRIERVNLANLWAGIHYRTGRGRAAKPYPGPVTLFMPQHDPDAAGREALDQWRRLLRVEPEIVPVPGTHTTVIQGAGAELIGARLRAEITKVRKQSSDEGGVSR
jgi:thioesterase domain-containing protein